MSDHAARSALLRMHQREALIAMHYTGFASDMQMLATAAADQAEQAFQARKAELVAAYGLEPVAQTKPFAFSAGLAIIPVHGTLINRFGYSWGFVTGYNFIRQQTALAGQDPDVKGIAYDINTYGGEAAGCFECSDDIKRLANGKPTRSVIDSNCYSGGMAIAAGTDYRVCTPSGGVGSVGVVAMHVSMEKLLDELGIKVTFIHAGAHKVDGNPFEDLSPEVKADIQKSIDKSYSAFTKLVAKGCGMEEKAVRATEARTYRADDALSIGFIDAIASPHEAMSAFMGELSGSKPQLRKESAMSTATNQPGGNTTATGEDLAKVQADAAAAERTRVAGIQTCDEAKGRETLAAHLAFKTSMSVADAKAMLAAAPVTAAAPAPAATVNPLAAAMEATGGGPKVGATDGATNGANEDAAGGLTPAQRLIANARTVGIEGYGKTPTH